jgi:hypothetical protein
MFGNGLSESIREAIPDIAIYLMYFCHDLGIDMEGVVERKLAANRKKYPGHKALESTKKYNEYRAFQKKDQVKRKTT